MTRILSVEDDVDLQRLLGLALAGAEFDVQYAFTGPEGYEKAVSFRPDVILCDLMLPGYDGRELIAKLKAEPSICGVPIVVITAHYDSATLVETEIRKLGIIEYLRKPVRHEDLVRLIRKIVGGSRPDSRSSR